MMLRNTTCLFILLAVPAAWSQTATYTLSNENVRLTGIGANANGRGQSRVDWGTCQFDGTITRCSITAPYTGFNGPGTIKITLTYGGNGISPWLAVSTTPGSDLVNFGLQAGATNTAIQISLTGANGITVDYLSTAFNFFYDNSATCTGTSVSACGPGQVGLNSGAIMTGKVRGTFEATPVIRANQGVITASAYGGFSALTPGTWMEIYGTNLANVASRVWGGSDFRGNAAPTALAGTTVTIGGKSAFVSFISPTQINAQVPSDVSPGSQPVVVTTPGGRSTAYNVTVNAIQPGFLAPASFATEAGQYVAALLADGRTFVLPPGTIQGLGTARAKPGDIIIIYAIGFGPVTPDSPAGLIVTEANRLSGTFQISIGGVAARVLFGGLTRDLVGLYQFNVEVPNIPAGDAVPVTFTLNGTAGAQKLITAIGN